jgi:hypothetical protein
MDFLFALFPIIFVLFFMGFIALFIYAIQANKKRTEELAQKASAMQLAFSPVAPEAFTKDLSAMSYFADPRNKTYSKVLYGKAGGLSVHIFEYLISQDSAHPTVTHSGPDGAITGHSHPQSTSSIYSVVYLRGTVALPQFQMQSSTFLDGIAKKLFGMQDINIDTHPVFSKEWVLQSKDENAVRKLFTPEVLAHCEKIPKDTLVAEGERLVMMRLGHLMPDKVEGLLREALTLHEVLRKSAGA